MNFQKEERKNRLAILENVSDKEGISANAVEKDWWVSIVLKAIFQTSSAPFLLFKGGTSLSKSWNIIQRFSEDIDLALDRSFWESDNEPQNNSQLKKLRKKSKRYIESTLLQELDEQLTILGVGNYSLSIEEGSDTDKDPTVINLSYTSILAEKKEYVKAVVKIEISCLSMLEPSEERPISSLISQHVDNVDTLNYCLVKTVLPSRTFLEKAFLLHEEFCKEKPRSKRMSRHLYDLEKLMDTSFAKQALSDTTLYKDIVRHRAKFYHLSGVDYEQHSPSSICFSPPSHLLDAWGADYKEMQAVFIYGDSLNFKALLERMNVLTTRFRAITMESGMLVSNSQS